jgi:hypothetical protein
LHKLSGIINQMPLGVICRWRLQFMGEPNAGASQQTRRHRPTHRGSESRCHQWLVAPCAACLRRASRSPGRHRAPITSLGQSGRGHPVSWLQTFQVPGAVANPFASTSTTTSPRCASHTCWHRRAADICTITQYEPILKTPLKTIPKVLDPANEAPHFDQALTGRTDGPRRTFAARRLIVVDKLDRRSTQHPTD